MRTKLRPWTLFPCDKVVVVVMSPDGVVFVPLGSVTLDVVAVVNCTPGGTSLFIHPLTLPVSESKARVIF